MRKLGYLCTSGKVSKYRISRRSIILAFVTGTTSWFNSCSTVDDATGRCKPFSSPKYVASSVDTNGKKWEMRITPEVADLKCDYQDPTKISSGKIVFSVVISDGQGYSKPALSVRSSFVGSSSSQDGAGFFPNPDGDDDVATDSCGVAIFKVKWTCPAPKKSAGGYFYVTSGPLSSKPVKVTLEHPVQQDQVTTAPAPAPAQPAGLLPEESAESAAGN
ncbi:MAG: hypothetical protein EBR09_08820 [Proteobacteria bacterium]|nr:hypothetical protein [Pseudomonadota bacterium]